MVTRLFCLCLFKEALSISFGLIMFIRLDNRIPRGLAMLAGVLLTLGRYSQSENSWTTLFNHLSTQNTATIASTLASPIDYGMQYHVQFGGVTKFVGCLCSCTNQLRSG